MSEQEAAAAAAATPAADTEQDEEAAFSQDAAMMDLYSRQLGAYGLAAMTKLIKLRVLICGMKGVGVEIAKNLVLAGPGAVDVHDDEPAALRDLGGNFFITEADVGRPRGEVVAPKLQELNSMVSVRCHTGALDEDYVKSFSAVVFTNCGDKDELTRWGDFCHDNNVAFLAADVRGIFGYAFSDFGAQFTVRDKSGETPATRIVTDITCEEKAVVRLLGALGEEGGRMHGVQDDDHEGWIELSDVEGLVNPETGKSINVMGAVRARSAYRTVTEKKKKDDGTVEEKTKQVFDPYRLTLDLDTRGWSAYENGGVLTQVKQPVTVNNRCLSESLRQPVSPGEFGLLFTDGLKFGRGEQLHIALLALWEFHKRNGNWPRANNDEDAEVVLTIAKEINAANTAANESNEPSEDGRTYALAVEELDEHVVRVVARKAALELQPYAAFFGGVVAQEVVKLTGKFSPLNQWLHLDCIELLPGEGEPAPSGDGEGKEGEPTPVEEEKPAQDPANFEPMNSRYDDLIELLGRDVHEKVRNARTFMVGCGALGCEFLKNFALTGLATSETGLITVTDNDRIEVSNLNRQFLFREDNVGQPKSIAAAGRATTMNPDIKITAEEHLAAPHTENVFNDQFWESLDFVTNALDNVKARLYVDGRCVFYGKPLLESGTLGTKCNVQVVVPHVTCSYADGPEDNADEDNIPMCTLRNFPSLIEHCIEWSRAQFEDVFVKPFADAKKFVANKAEFLEQQRAAGGSANTRATAIDEMRVVIDLVQQSREMTFEKCVELAFNYFHNSFRNKIMQLVFNFPEDHVTDSGDRFWSGAKRFPQAATLDPHDPVHINFITAVANIYAAAYGVVPPPESELLPADHQYRDVNFIREIVARLDVPDFTPTKESIDTGDNKDGDEDGKDGAGDSKSNDDSASAPMDLEAEAAEFQRLVDALDALDATGCNIEPADFEKDQDLNFHIDFISTASNLRAANYRIKQASRHKCKMIAGKIIPAIATATASACGMVTVELLKVLQNKPLEALRDSSNNLGLNMYMLQEPMPPAKAKEEYDPIEMTEVKTFPEGFTKWDKIIVNEGRKLTMQEFFEAFRRQTNLRITVFYHNAANLEGPAKGRMLYESFAWKKELAELYEARMNSDLVEWIRERYEGVDVITDNRTYIELQTSCSDENDVVYKTPTVVYRWG